MTDEQLPPNDGGKPPWETLNRFSRRQLLRAAGLGGAAFAVAPLLAACGDDDDAATTDSTGTTAAGGEAAPAGDIQKILDFIEPVEEEFSGKGTQYELGLVLAFTGPGSFFGRTMSAGAKLAAEHISSSGSRVHLLQGPQVRRPAGRGQRDQGARAGQAARQAGLLRRRPGGHVPGDRAVQDVHLRRRRWHHSFGRQTLLLGHPGDQRPTTPGPGR